MRVRSQAHQARPKAIDATSYAAKARRIGTGASDARIPELRPLADKRIVLFGLGCLGAASAMEFARAGVRHLVLVDYDDVDPATIVRWPRGIAVGGLRKTAVIEDWIKNEYPSCSAVGVPYRLGRVRRDLDNERSDEAVVADLIKEVSLVYDATAELGVQHFLTDLARHHRIPYVGVSGTYGAWGGKVFRFDPSRSQGCWLCYRRACDEGSISEPPSDGSGVVQPRGCADPTFTGSNFDMAQIAMSGVRTAVSTLCSGSEGGYPSVDWDILHIALRNDAGNAIVPAFSGIRLSVHPACQICNET